MTYDDFKTLVTENICRAGTPTLSPKVLWVWDLDNNNWCSLNMDYTQVTIAE
jgi:hypothetical protein